MPLTSAIVNNTLRMSSWPRVAGSARARKICSAQNPASASAQQSTGRYCANHHSIRKYARIDAVVPEDVDHKHLDREAEPTDEEDPCPRAAQLPGELGALVHARRSAQSRDRDASQSSSA